MLEKLCLLILFEIDLHNLLTSPPTYTLGWECFPLTPTSGPPRYTRGWGCLICVGQTEECQQPKIVLILWFYSLLYTHLDRCVDSGCHKLSENVWFVWSKASYSGDKWRCHRCGTGRTSEYRTTQLLICEKLSLAMFSENKKYSNKCFNALKECNARRLKQLPRIKK